MNLLNRLTVGLMPIVPKPIIRKISSRYIAGETIADAVRVIRGLENEGCCATVDILGEYITLKEEALAAVEGYLEALEMIHAEGVDSNVSVKLTALGLGLDEEFCFENIKKIVEKAGDLGNFVRIDMEDSQYTTKTIELYRRLRKSHDNVGVVLQAYLRRTRSDVANIINGFDQVNFRLCKGIYVERREIAYKEPELINMNYANLLEEMLKKGVYVGIATHDEKLVWRAFEIIDRLQIPKENYEFQMLLGVDEELRRIIVSEKRKLRVYVPFGEHWYGYSSRRLKENPQIAGYIIKNFFDSPRKDA